MNKVPCESAIKKLIKFLDDRNKKQDNTEYRITEWFSESDPVTYIVNNLKLEYEDEILFRPDFLETTMRDPDYVIRKLDNVFAPHIEMITFHTIMDAITITLISDKYSGYIRINY